MTDLFRPRRINLSSHSVRHIPKWLPGAGFKKEAARVNKLVEHIRFVPWELFLKDTVRRFFDHRTVIKALIFPM